MANKILITGAAGGIGQLLTNHLSSDYDLILADQRPPAQTAGFPFHTIDIADLAGLQPLFAGVDTVIHLAADPRMQAPWESLLPNNIIGTYNVFQAAHEAGCRRIIYTSSINAVFGYPDDVQVRTDMPVAPPNLYGATKAWGEALARFYSDQKGLAIYCLRLGAVTAADGPVVKAGHPYLSLVLTHGDLIKLFDACLAAPDEVRFGIFHGVSDNRWKRLDLSDTRRILGYAPTDDAFVLAGVVGEDRPDTLFENEK